MLHRVAAGLDIVICQCFTSPFTSNCCARARCWCSGRPRCRRPRSGSRCRCCFTRRRLSGLAQLLAVGHEFQFDSGVGPPLAYWLAEIAFRGAGLFGVYVLAQICVVTTYWCVFALGRAIVGPTHATMAVLLMVGISLFTVPSPDFGPPILAMALWAVVLLHYWRAAIEHERRSWYALAVAAALLLLTSDAALILLGALVVFTAVTQRGRAALDAIEAWVVALALVPFLFLHLVWLDGMGNGLIPALARLRDAALADANTAAWLRLLAALILAHVGLAILLVLAGGWPRVRASPAPPLGRPPVDPFAVTYVKVFALAPGLLATIAAVLLGRALPAGGAAPLVVLSGLALVIAAGDSIALYHQRILGFAWAGLLVVPAIFVPILIVLLPWTAGIDLQVAQPANAMGRFFADSFERRTGQPLAVVTGDPRHRRARCARRAEPAQRLFRRRSGPLALGHRRRYPQERRCRRVARGRHRR